MLSPLPIAAHRLAQCALKPCHHGIIWIGCGILSELSIPMEPFLSVSGCSRAPSCLWLSIAGDALIVVVND